MTIFKHHGLLSLALYALLTGTAQAQTPEPLFVVPNGASAGDGRTSVGMRLDHLFAGATERVLLNVADHDWIATRERIDVDLLGHRVWVGHIDGLDYSHVSFAERGGIVAGLINGVSHVYEVRTLGSGRYLVASPGSDQRDGELQPRIPSLNRAADVDSLLSNQAADDRGTIDVLLLYTASAMAQVGGASQIQALVAQIISDSNTIFARSGVTTRFRLVGAQQFGLTESASMSGDLDALTFSPEARALRNQFQADIVQLLENAVQGTTCGVAWQLTSFQETDFDAYSVADVDCASQYTPTHEMAHNMGSNHAPEDDASAGLFPYSYGFKDPVRGFRTVMAYSCVNGNCPRIPNMSNPTVLNNGGATGTQTQNNALSINNAAETVANFRRQALTGTPPSAPTGLRASVNGNLVTLSWNAVMSDTLPAFDAATSYTLQVGTSPGVYSLLTLNVGNTTTVSGNAPGGTFVWRVIANNSAGNSAPSSESSFTVGTCLAPAAPQNLGFSVSGSLVILTWSAPLSGTTPFTYVVEAGSTSGAANLFNGNIGGSTTLQAQAPPGVYYVRVRAQNTCGTGPASAERVIAVP